MMVFRVSGMHCGNCARTVSRAVESLPRVERALVDLERGEVTVEGEADETSVRHAVEQAGYAVEARLDGSP